MRNNDVIAIALTSQLVKKRDLRAIGYNHQQQGDGGNGSAVS
ncbi:MULTISPECIES: hypothetical protein [unclassified Microcoleus]